MSDQPDRSCDERLDADLARLAELAELEGSTQPTRDEIARCIADYWDSGNPLPDDSPAYEIADSLIRRGWLGVSDTPNEGDANE